MLPIFLQAVLIVTYQDLTVMKSMLLKYSPHQTLQVTHKTVHIAFASCLVDDVLVIIVS